MFNLSLEGGKYLEKAKLLEINKEQGKITEYKFNPYKSMKERQKDENCTV